MTTYNWPTSLIPQRMSISYRGVNKRFVSPLNSQAQVASRPGSLLSFDLAFEILTEAQRAELTGFLAKLDGQANWFTIPWYGHVRLGTGAGTPVVSGAGQVGASINTSGWTAGNLVLKRGDTVGIGGELKIITDDVTSDGSGLAALPVRPSQRIAPSNGSAIIVTDPTGTFMLDSAQNAVQSIVSPDIRLGTASFAIIEAVAQP